MHLRARTVPAAMALSVVLFAGCGGRWFGTRGNTNLQKSLTFHASFDRGTDADLAQADAWLYHAPAMEKWGEARPGLPDGDAIRLEPGEGRFGGALHFVERADPVVFYRAAQNVPWTPQDWSGSVSFWLRADLDELAEGYCDPVQITPRRWNDAAFFVEFEKRGEQVPFRLGVYPDFKVWNPRDREWGEIPASEKPLITVNGPPFSGDRWTHVVVTWERFNTGNPEGTAVLYLDGVQVGAVIQRTQTFTWDPAETRFLLGLGYVGWIDEIAVFNRALNAEEARQIYLLPNGIRSLQQPR